MYAYVLVDISVIQLNPAPAPSAVTKYQKRISGPMLDRIGIHIEVSRADYEKLSGDRVGESSELIRARVQAAHNVQQKRFSNHNSDIVCNVDMRVEEIRQFCRSQDEGRSLMRGHDATQSVGARLSPHPETGADHRRFGREQ